MIAGAPSERFQRPANKGKREWKRARELLRLKLQDLRVDSLTGPSVLQPPELFPFLTLLRLK